MILELHMPNWVIWQCPGNVDHMDLGAGGVEKEERVKDKKELKTDHSELCLTQSWFRNIYELTSKYNGWKSNLYINICICLYKYFGVSKQAHICICQ